MTRASSSGQRAKQLYKAPLFLFLINDIERVYDCLHAGVGAPQRDRKPENESEAEFSTISRKAANLLAQEIDCSLRQDSGEKRKVITDG